MRRFWNQKLNEADGESNLQSLSYYDLGDSADLEYPSIYRNYLLFGDFVVLDIPQIYFRLF